MEPDHLVSRPPNLIFPCPDRWPCRSRYRGSGACRNKTRNSGTIILFMVLSPIIGFILAFFFMACVLWIAKGAQRMVAERHFRRLQLFSAAAYSFSHGTNDAQKTMGIITPLLFSIGYYGASVDPNNLPVPLWVILAAHAAIALGTLTGGWRIVKTMGTISPVSGPWTGLPPRHPVLRQSSVHRLRVYPSAPRMSSPRRSWGSGQPRGPAR